MNTDMGGGFDLTDGGGLSRGDPCCDPDLSKINLAELFSRRVVRTFREAPRQVEGVKEEDLVRPQTPTSLPPAIDPAPESTDALVAKELYKLSLQDRNRVMEELHGVKNSAGVGENEELLEKSIAAMEAELQQAPFKSAFAEARLRDAACATEKEFYIKFLMAESFNPKGAAKRMLAFFEYKLELFGIEKLTRKIGIRDLLENPSDKMTLESGLFQPLVHRDRSGRIVIGKFQKLAFSHLPLQSRLRVFFYLLMTTTEHDVDLRRGIVLLVANQEGVVDRMDAWRNTTLLGALPVRVNGFHVIHNDPSITVLSSLAMLAMGPDYRARFRVHEGSILENIYSMETFGISSRTVPLDSTTGEVGLDSLNRWIDMRLLVEGSTSLSADEMSASQSLLEPTEGDVIFGRGKGIQNHAGNIRLRQLIDSYRPRYESARLLDKTVIADELVQEFKYVSGRFLKKDGDDGWVEVTDEMAREKISHVFRDRRRKNKLQEN